MSTGHADVASFFETAEFDAASYEHYLDLTHSSFTSRERFESLLNDFLPKATGGNDALKAGLGLLMLGRFGEALDTLAKAPSGKVRHWYAAVAAIALNRFDQALDELKQASSRGWDQFEVDMQTALIHLATKSLPGAERLVAKHDNAGKDRAEWYFLKGRIAETQSQYADAIDLYERALTLNPDHAQAMFRAAWLYDLRGEDEQAIEHYERLALQPRAYVNALINMAVIYEDQGRIEAAAECLRRVLRVYPNDARARLYLKDVESSQHIGSDDATKTEIDPRQRMLEKPVADFDLSVRARNCLKKMKIHTLGELIRLSEAELLAYKNFGETSLNEIKALLQRFGMRLGQSPEEIDVTAIVDAPPPPAPRVAVPPGREAMLSKPVAELELSVRARRCLQRLNVASVADLLNYTEADLLATRNFGQTSLNEVKARLGELGLHLAAKVGE